MVIIIFSNKIAKIQKNNQKFFPWYKYLENFFIKLLYNKFKNF
jgi:hypothetical protein